MGRLALLLFFALPGFAAERRSVPVRMVETPSLRAVPRVTFPTAHFTLVVRRPAGLDGLPDLTAGARFASVRLGSRPIVLAFDAPAGTAALGMLYSAGKEPAVGRARPLGTEGFRIDFEAVACSGVRCNVSLLDRGARAVTGSLELSHHRRGRAALGGAVREVILVDADADGHFNGGRDRWIAIRMDRVKKVPALREPEASLLNEPQIPFAPDGLALMVERVARDGSSLVLVQDRPKMAMAEVLDRRYGEVRAEHFGRFELERASFELKWGLDPTRPVADRPLAWQSMTLTEARVTARKQGKPLLVAFYSETNTWCYRYEYYTFPDKEVDSLLRRFVLVRIDVEKDREGTYRQSGARGLPTLMPRDPAGKPVSFRVRNRDPQGKVHDLEQSETMITGWQRPQELAVNLRRILQAAAVDAG
ncbi:MAG: thioredoxin family protein [Planctomycetota bacterium]